jgi:hypothetical protein
MKKISLLIVMALMVCKADTLSVNHDTVWQKIMVKDTSVSMQMKYVPIVVQKIEQTKPKNKVPQYVLGGSIIACSIFAGTVAICNASIASPSGWFNDDNFGGSGLIGARNTRIHCIYFALSLTGILAGIAVMIN